MMVKGGYQDSDAERQVKGPQVERRPLLFVSIMAISAISLPLIVGVSIRQPRVNYYVICPDSRSRLRRKMNYRYFSRHNRGWPLTELKIPASS